MLHVHYADRADHLVGALAGVLRQPPADPFARDIVAVHSRGIERWVAQQLSHTLGAGAGRNDGIAANLDFPMPGRLVADAIARATGTDPGTDPWRPDRLIWPLLAAVTDAQRRGESDRLGPLAIHLVADDDPAAPSPRRLGAVRRVADLFDRYATHRPQLLQAWAADRDVDATGRPLATRSRWQPWLWRRLRDRVDLLSPPERLAQAVDHLAAGTGADGAPLDVELPDRLALFGLTALPTSYLQVLSAIARGPTSTAPHGRDIHLLLLHPSPALWARVAEHLAAAPERPTAVAREDDPTRSLPRSPLLAAWGRDARELQLTVGAVRADHHDVNGEVAAPPDATLLGRLQADVRADQAPHSPGAEDRRPVLAEDDRSFQLHRCHGRTRQVEVLRDVVLGLLADDPDLEPRDIVVLCPDIEVFAPIVRAAFGDGGAADNGPELRVQLADRALRQTNPVLRVVAEVLELADGRVTASSILDLCARGPVRARFGLDDDDLERIEERLLTTGIRWGLDARHRDTHGVPTGANTWRAGLDRLLTGVAVDDVDLRTVGGVTPEGGVEGSEVDLVGRLAELMARVADAVARLGRPQPLAAWLAAITRVADQLCYVGPDDDWQRLQLTRLLDAVRDAAGMTEADPDLPLTLHEVRDLLGYRLEGSPSGAAHRTGDLTVCTLVPMRAVPHRVVVLLGMDDEVFPRRTIPDGDDLLAAAPLVGDRDPRTEDRQLLLDALLAAGSHLVVLTTGHDERTNNTRPPAVPIGELLEVVDHTVRSGVTDADGGEVPASAVVAVDHPLQPFAPDRFAPGGIGHRGRPAVAADLPFGFDRDDLAAATAATEVPLPPSAFVDVNATLPAPAAATEPLASSDLAAFLVHPCRALLKQRLGLTFPWDGDAPDDALPVELPGGLARYAVGDRLLAFAAAGASLDRAIEVERGRGMLPPGDLATVPLDELRATLEQIPRAAADHDVALDLPGRAIDVDVELPGGRRITGAVDDVVGTTRRRAAYSRLGPKHRLRAWLDLLLLTVQDPTRPWRAVTIGNARSGGPKTAVVSVSTLGPHDGVVHRGGRKNSAPIESSLGPPTGDPERRRRLATDQLAVLLDLFDRGATGPLPLPCKAAAGYAHAVWDGRLGISRRAPANAAGYGWETGIFPGEDADHANRKVLGNLSLDDLLALPPSPAEDGEGWFVDEETGRFGRLARRLWWPILAAEEFEDRNR